MTQGLASATPTGFDLAATTNTLIYTCPTGKRAVVSVSFCSRATDPVRVRLARGTGGAPASTDWLEYDAPVSPGAPLIRTGLALSAADKIWAYSDTAGVTVQIDGVEA